MREVVRGQVVGGTEIERTAKASSVVAGGKRKEKHIGRKRAYKQAGPTCHVSLAAQDRHNEHRA